MRAFERLVLHVELLCGRLAVLNIKKYKRTAGKEPCRPFCVCDAKTGTKSATTNLLNTQPHMFLSHC